MPAGNEYNLRADLEAARRNAELCAQRAGTEDKQQHYSLIKMELYLCEVQAIELLLET